MKNKIFLLILSLFNVQCTTLMQGNKIATYKINESNIRNLIIKKFDVNLQDIKQEKEIKDRKAINKLVDYINDNVKNLSKFPMHYIIDITYNDGTEERIIINGQYFKSSKKGTFKISKNIETYIEQLLE